MGQLNKQDNTMQMELAQRIRDVLVLDPEKGALEFKQTWYSWGQLQRGMDNIENLLNHADRQAIRGQHDHIPDDQPTAL